MSTRDYLVYPLLVALIILILTYFIIPVINKQEKRLEYKTTGPIKMLDKELIGNSITIGTQRTDQIFSYTAEIINTGDISIQQLAILYKFENTPSGFQILNHIQTTIPNEEFGEIIKLNEDTISIRYKYNLINSKDEIRLTILTNKEAQLKVHSKDKDLEFAMASIEDTKGNENVLQILSLILAAVASILTLSLKSFNETIIKAVKVILNIKKPSIQDDNIGNIFSGEWTLSFIRNSHGGSEKVKIDEKGRYYSNNEYSFNLHNRIIDRDKNRITFSKIRLNGEFHSNEDLTIEADDLITGQDSLGYKLKYKRTS